MIRLHIKSKQFQIKDVFKNIKKNIIAIIANINDI